QVVSGTLLRVDDQSITLWTPERLDHPTLLDRYSSEAVHDRTVRNLWRWLAVEPRLRALVSGALAPTFDDAAEAVAWATSPPHHHGTFNDEQRRAIARALATRDFLLVRGPPGTGKTAVVAEIARRAMARGERVLVAAFTNQAVDNVLRRLLAEGVRDFVRLGHELSVAPELRGHRLVARATGTPPAGTPSAGASGAAPPAPDPARMRAALAATPLVATTTATWSAERHDGAGEALRFDLAIVDEASQLTVPAILGALRFARRFVLVGDACQLPPLVMSAEAVAHGLKRSLFTDLLARWGEDASVGLTRQYRMHPAICGFSSREFYGGALAAAGAARTATLDLSLDPRHPLAAVLDPARPLVFVDIPEAVTGKASPAQASIAGQIVLALRRAGISAERIGIIAPYRAQAAAIRQRLATLGEREVPVDTVDRFQGAEREIILFSCGGRVGPDARGLDFLADPHRLNVALTRAQRKLLLLGNRAALAEVPLLCRLVAYCAALYDGHGGIVTARRA
ncbi:MAG: AAA family ATPase, partial [Ktedonobacterales bacterium]|nr:AAA family ATPase [Ktedonobacterales bacterium]